MRLGLANIGRLWKQLPAAWAVVFGGACILGVASFPGRTRSLAAAESASSPQESLSSRDIVWIEAEQFRQPGGWVNDAQFVDQMGSPFFLAIGLEGPVADAVTTVSIPRSATYRLWVRCRDWVPEFSPGKFQVVVGGKTSNTVFGASKSGNWIWEDGGEFALPAGELEIRLHDLTGHYGRCDALVLTSDSELRLPDDPAKIAVLRERYGGVSREIRDMGPYDTVVVGGGLAGTFAAVASARMGCRTALVQNRPVLGGNSSTEILVNPEGDTTREPLDPGEGGIIEEVRGDVFGYSDRLLQLVRNQPNLDLFLNTHAKGVELAGPNKIKAVLALDVNNGQRYRFVGTTFIDCTGDGAIGVWAGAEYRHGREPRSMYGESRAPEVGDLNKGTMGGTLRYATEQMAFPVKFVGPDWARHFPTCADFNSGRHPQLRFGGWQWVIEYGGELDTYKDAEVIRDELLRIIWGMWDHAKNHCTQLGDAAENFRLTWVSHVVGKRESRRLIGDYVMTEHDIANQTLFPDRVSYGGWGIDIHPPKGFYDPGPAAIFSHKVKFSVPFRSLYTKDIDNLMMAGRCISVTHAALGATRVMITCGLQGQAVGTAAGFCKRHETTPRVVYERYIGDLQQQLLKDGCYLIDLPNQDPRDLARDASVAASSVAPNDVYQPSAALTRHNLDHDRAVMFRWKGGHLESVAVHLESQVAKPLAVNAHFCRAKSLGDFQNAEQIAAVSVTVPPGSRDWVSVPIGLQLEPGYYYLWLPKTAGLSWGLFSEEPAETARAYRSGNEWHQMPGCYAFKTQPSSGVVLLLAEERADQPWFSPQNVVDGFARAIRGVPHSWRPDPAQALPQWVELTFASPVEFDTVHISFQSRALAANDFALSVWRDGQWQPLVRVTDNAQRRCVLTVPTTRAERLRLTIEKAPPEMGVCEIRVYHEEGQ